MADVVTYVYYIVVGGKPLRQMLWPVLLSNGRCYSHVADGNSHFQGGFISV